MVHQLSSAELILAAIGLILILLTQCTGLGIIKLFSKTNRELVKAKLFLGDTLMWMWIYATFAGVLFVINGFLFYLDELFDVSLGIFGDLIRTLFAASFFLMSFSWYTLFKKGIQANTREKK